MCYHPAMDRHPVDPGFEFVLDNRKLIVIFALLLAVCAGFFVFGFVEGKRQAVQVEVQKAPPPPSVETPPAPTPPPVSEPETKAASDPAPAVADTSIREQLEWYKNVKDQPESTPKRKDTKAATTKAAKKAEPAASNGPAQPDPATVPSHPLNASSDATTFSVQVAAYKNRSDAESRAGALRSKGYEPTIDANPQQNLYHLKVGRFNSRAEASAMELKLKRDGFSTIIKKNNP